MALVLPVSFDGPSVTCLFRWPSCYLSLSMTLVLPVSFNKNVCRAIFTRGNETTYTRKWTTPPWAGDVASTNSIPVLTTSGTTGCQSPTHNERQWPHRASGELEAVLVFRFLCFLRRKNSPTCWNHRPSVTQGIILDATTIQSLAILGLLSIFGITCGKVVSIRLYDILNVRIANFQRHVIVS